MRVRGSEDCCGPEASGKAFGAPGPGERGSQVLSKDSHPAFGEGSRSWVPDPGHCVITPQVSSVQGSKAVLQSSSARPAEADGGPHDAPRITSLHLKEAHSWSALSQTGNGRWWACQGRRLVQAGSDFLLLLLLTV